MRQTEHLLIESASRLGVGFKTPWNGVGKSVEGLSTAAEAMRKAKLDWRVAKDPTYFIQKTDGKPKLEEVPGRFAIVRQDTQECLGSVGAVYTAFQNSEAFKFFDAIVGEGRAIYDSAGTFQGGRKVWISAKLNPEDFRPNRSLGLGHFIVLTNTFDGKGCIKMLSLARQFFCMNQITGKSVRISIPHFPNLREKVEAAREALGIVTKEMRDLEECLKEIREIKMSDAQVKDFAYMIGETDYERNLIPTLFREGIGCEGKTRMDALNAVTQMTTHHMRVRGDETVRAEKLLNGVIEGRGAKMQQRAMAFLTGGDL